MDAEFSSRALMETKKGYYFGTEKGGVWWKRYLSGGWFSRGLSEIWIKDDGLYFRRYLTKKVMHISIDEIAKITIDSGGHAGKWTGGFIMKIKWHKDDLELVSGFIVSGSKEGTEKWGVLLNDLIKQVKR